MCTKEPISIYSVDSKGVDSLNCKGRDQLRTSLTVRTVYRLLIFCLEIEMSMIGL